MATTSDFVGKNCPFCGAVDSLQTDDALGEVACTECALVVAMGLEENALTRYNKDATYDDVDRHREGDEMNPSSSSAAAAAAGGAAMGGASLGGVNLAKVTLHPAMLNCIRGLQKKSGAPEQAIGRAVDIAKHVVGGRRARGQRLEKQQDVAAACFMIAAEQLNHPVPLAELRCLDASLGDVEYRRAEIVKETRMEEEERRLKSVFVDNLLTTYLLKLGLQVSLYMPHCKRLLEALRHVEALAYVGVVDRVIMSLLLARTSRSFQWEGKPPAHQSNNSGAVGGAPTTEALYANFAAKAHLDVGKVKKVMQTAADNLRAIVEAFDAAAAAAAADARPVNSSRKEDDDGDVGPEAKRVKVEEV
ncbi:transcription factor IIB [Trypanosoma grayi]|uniref:transcription factor IIB n=1 Tax=Trypanosoma grayi TaxID=71804 RepID=UPI0004F4AE11|nr:transcription factor IIB [Trypanosoma grayi]KEG09617.1 transcription factor IIB [Trypanosoma grayi]